MGIDREIPQITPFEEHARRRFGKTEIFFGIVSPVGTPTDSFVSDISGCLKGFGYKLVELRLSKYLDEAYGHILGHQGSGQTEDERLSAAMSRGTKLRQMVGTGDILARHAMMKIQEIRDEDEKPVAYLFRTLKHPSEVDVLRRVYGDSFHLIGLYASDEERLRELTAKHSVEDGAARELLERDRFEEEGFGQQTREVFHLADFFVRWDGSPDRDALWRYLDLVFGNPFHTPTCDEHAMFLAFSASLRSGELSRQVGAAITTPMGDLVAVGTNDVPSAGGGLYWPGLEDQRDLIKGHDSNTKRRAEVMREVSEALGGPLDKDVLKEKLKPTALYNITEYGRAVHAEMDAILVCARNGISTRGSAIYVTTFPCHNCARHIVAAGIMRAVFIEPYPKSKALDLHGDSITLASAGQSGSKETKVRFEPFLGVGPRRYLDYFSLALGGGNAVERKTGFEGDKAAWTRDQAYPRSQMSRAYYADLEKVATADLGRLTPERIGEEATNEDNVD